MTEATPEAETTQALLIGGPYSGKTIDVRRSGAVAVALTEPDMASDWAAPDPTTDEGQADEVVYYTLHRLFMGQRTLYVAMHPDATEDDLLGVILTADTQRAMGLVP